ncbi:MAG: M20/M25/M40 family metallo-hydrolase [Gemmatimonadota bacterium]|nr:M20/M25/M40 family metallo-hydrolase [Gemmatimonadota bacterium]
MYSRLNRAGLAIALYGALAANAARGQDLPAPPVPPPLASLQSWLRFDAPPGDESRLTNAVIAADGRWHRDQAGNLITSTGSGHPRRLVACALDHPGFVVGGITDQGYLRLRRVGSNVTHPLFDQFQQAQQIKVLTKHGVVPGVVAVDNVHFAQEHRADTLVVNVDQLWVDIGARSRREVVDMGVSLMDPVARDMPQWEYEHFVAGPDVSGRAGCAAVAMVARAAAGDPRHSGETVFVLSTQSSFGWRGLDAAAARLGAFDSATLVASAPLTGGAPTNIARTRIARPTRGVPDVGLDSLNRVSIRARFPGSLVESVDVTDLDSLGSSVAIAAGVRMSASPWLVLAAPALVSTHQKDSLSYVAAMLAYLVEQPGVGNREAPIRRAIRSELPDWARRIAVQDSAGNLIVAVGPDRDTTVFLAHMDEVGYIVRSIEPDGMVTLTSQGGLNGAAWEGQPAIVFSTVHGPDAISPEPRGVFVPREHANLRRPDSLTAWFGPGAGALDGAGVRPGDAVTAYKRGERIGDTRFTARALDDRAGDTALLLALREIDPAKLQHKLIFVWSVEEELGLNGATALARRIGSSVHHVYAIDTFVSSDTPLESAVFAHAPLGEGPVLRASDDGMVMFPAEQERIESIARANHIPLQVGTTKGSTDAVPFVARGAIGAQLGWPGRYSHSPAEVLDLNDLKNLARLVRVLAQ